MKSPRIEFAEKTEHVNIPGKPTGGGEREKRNAGSVCTKKRRKRIRRSIFICVTAVLSAALIISVVFNFLQYKRLRTGDHLAAQKLKELDEVNRENIRNEEALRSAEEKIKNTQEQLQKLSEKLVLYESDIEKFKAQEKLYEFYKKNAVVISMDNSEVYHRYGCNKLNIASGYWIYNVSLAKSKGYSACPDCIVQ